jgi:hypothetical protein
LADYISHVQINFHHPLAMFGLFVSQCQICGSGFKKQRYRWTIRGKKAWVCPRCNTQLERRTSSAAFGTEVDYPEVRNPGGCGCRSSLGCLGIGFLLLVVIALLAPKTTVPDQTGLSDSPQLPQSTLSTAPSVKVPLFQKPSRAVAAPISLGLQDTSPEKPAWRNGEGEWYGLSKIITHKGAFSKVGDVDNDITCMHTSSDSHQVMQVRWTANVFNLDGASSTLPKFKELCLSYCRQLGSDLPESLFENVDTQKGQFLETSHAVFEIKRLDYKLGYGWIFTIKSK